MGNYMTITQNPLPSDASGRVILLDGTVYAFNKPLTVAELMLEHPRQVVVELSSSQGLTQKRPTPLPADKKLDTKKVYLMLPMKRGKVASLSSEEAKHVLFSANKVLRSRASILSSPRFLPMFARICPVGVGGEEADHNKLVAERSRGAGTNNVVKEERTCSSSLDIVGDEEGVEGRPQYLSRQISGKGWKPSLDTIEEKKVEKIKMPHWLF